MTCFMHYGAKHMSNKARHMILGRVTHSLPVLDVYKGVLQDFTCTAVVVPPVHLSFVSMRPAILNALRVFPMSP